MKLKIPAILLLLLIFLISGGSIVEAQQRPTPTTIPPTSTPTAVPPTATPTVAPSATPTGDTGGTANPAAAQTATKGILRGTVYEDTNGDGKCQGTGEPILTGITIQFAGGPNQETLTQTSVDDGTFSLAADFGTWQISAIPPTGSAVTSEKTQTVTIDTRQQVVNVDFCVSAVRALLPESGAAADPGSPLLYIALVGAFLVVTGVGLHWRKRVVPEK